MKCKQYYKVRVLLRDTIHDRNRGKIFTLFTPCLYESLNGLQFVDSSLSTLSGVERCDAGRSVGTLTLSGTVVVQTRFRCVKETGEG